MLENTPPSPNNWEKQQLEKLLFATLQEQKRSRRWGIFFKLLIMIYLVLVFVPFVPSLMSQKEMREKHTALIDINGIIAEGKHGSADLVATSLRRAYENEHVAGIILRINSPGGSPVQAGYIYDEINRLKKTKPDIKIYGVITDLGASAAYYIATACDEIYADKASLVGSIGVILPTFGVVEAMNKLGIENRTIISGENKSLLDPMAPEKPEQRKFAQGLLDIVHTQFIDAVQKGRGARLKSDTPGIFSGLIWTGEQAVAIGIVDGLGSTGYVARTKIGNDNIVDYTVNPSIFERFTTGVGTVVSDNLMQTLGSPTQLR